MAPPFSVVPSLLVGALAIAASGCAGWGSVDCNQACTLAEQCRGLDKTFLLSCSTLAGGCFGSVSDCAACITSSATSCQDLLNGTCDAVCLAFPPDAGTGDAGP